MTRTQILTRFFVFMRSSVSKRTHSSLGTRPFSFQSNLDSVIRDKIVEIFSSLVARVILGQISLTELAAFQEGDSSLWIIFGHKH